MRKVISESPPVAILCDSAPVVQNISWFKIGNGMARLNREKLMARQRAERLGTIHGDIATLSMLDITVTDMEPILGERYEDLIVYAGQLQAAFAYPQKALTRRLFQRGLVEVAQRPAPLDLTEIDKAHLSYLLDGKKKTEIQDLLGFPTYRQYRNHFEALIARTGWRSEHLIALAGLMNGQLKIFHNMNYPRPNVPPQLPLSTEPLLAPHTDVWTPAVPPVKPFLPPSFPPATELTGEEIRRRYMDDPGLY